MPVVASPSPAGVTSTLPSISPSVSPAVSGVPAGLTVAGSSVVVSPGWSVVAAGADQPNTAGKILSKIIGLANDTTKTVPTKTTTSKMNFTYSPQSCGFLVSSRPAGAGAAAGVSSAAGAAGAAVGCASAGGPAWSAALVCNSLSLLICEPPMSDGQQLSPLVATRRDVAPPATGCYYVKFSISCRLG